ncbi:hypothetical protein BDR07DRAFT_1463714 [Suillus spraguei]|nr:hypothetical protein BDR07DRAFT_1463714 [Suillus spraguei]
MSNTIAVQIPSQMQHIFADILLICPADKFRPASGVNQVELVNQTKTTIVTDTKIDTIKKHQPSTKPMRVSAKITAQNLCALDWQSNDHQKEPASVFACYWNGLSKTDKEVYKCKAATQLKSAGVSTTGNNVE